MVPDDPDDTPIAFFRRRGIGVRIEERDLHAEHMAKGEPGRASFYVEGRNYHCVTLLREDGSVLFEDFARGETADSALLRARSRYRQ